MLERHYQAKLIERLRERFDGCFIIKNDASYIQGIPDLLILFYDMWAVLEVKESRRARLQPNQQYYIDILGEMSFAAIIYPEIEGDVLDALQQTFESRRKACIPRRK